MVSSRFNSTEITRVLLLLCALALPTFLLAEVLVKDSHGGERYQVEEIASGLFVPWAMSLIDNQTLLVTERQGSAKLVNRFSGQLTPLRGLPQVLAEGQGGLLDVATSPHYQTDGWVYFTYSKARQNGGATTLARAKLEADQLKQWQDLLITQSQTNTSRHYGSRISFDQQGHIFFTVGDRGKRDLAQDLSNHAGTVIRLKLDGSVPSDNPFLKQQNALPEIWSYGHRNPQGIAYDQKNNRLWSIEHGPRGGDEINFVRKGLNYGWPVISYGKEYWAPISVGESTHKEGMEQPAKYYVPSIAPSSLLLYSGQAFKNWQGKLFAGALKLTHINMVSVSREGKLTNEERLLDALGERIRALLQSPEGWIYASTDTGKILKISPQQ